MLVPVPDTLFHILFTGSIPEPFLPQFEGHLRELAPKKLVYEFLATAVTNYHGLLA